MTTYRLRSEAGRSGLRLLLGAAMAASLLLGPGMGHVAASNACTPPLANYFDGFDTRTLHTYGSYAYLNVRVGALCTGGSGTSAAWTMVADDYYTGNGGYAQSGYASIQGHITARPFSQWRQAQGYTPTTVWCVCTVSTTTLYATNYHFNTGHLYMYVNNSVYDSTNFDPAVSWSAPWDSQYFGETWYLGDDMPGILTGHVTFGEVRYVSSRVSGWVTVPSGYFSSDSPRYGQTLNLNQFDIWTDPLH